MNECNLDLEQIRSQLETDGYVIVPGVVSARSVERLRSDLTQVFAPYAQPGEDVFATIRRLDAEDSGTLYRAYQFITKTFTSLDGIRSDVMPLLEALLPPGIVLDLGSAVIFGIPENDRLTWQWHQEAPYDPGIAPILSVNMPVFERADFKNGSISLLKGSHKLGSLPYDRVQEAADASTSLVPQGINQLVDDFEEVCFEADPGDIILFYENLVHRSNLNTTSRPRVTFVGRFASATTLPEHATIIDGKPY